MTERGRTTLIWLPLVLLVAVVALAGGMMFHGDLEQLFHKGQSNGGATTTEAAVPGQLWRCAMHPEIIRDHPGDCPICHMKLEPFKPGTEAEVVVDPVVVQNMGVRVASVEKGDLVTVVRTVGMLAEPEQNHWEMNLRVSGWIQKLHADKEGMEVAVGDPLFELYSPDLQVAIEELIAARKSAATMAKDGDAGLKQTADMMVAAAKRKLLLLGLTDKQVNSFAGLDKAPATVTFVSPLHGHITEKTVVEGSMVKMGERVLRIANRQSMWLLIQVYETQMPYVKVGTPVRAMVEAAPGKVFEGKVDFIYPHLDPATRTAQARVVIDNHDHSLHENMFATAEIRATAAKDVVLIPRESLIDTGTKRYVFVVAGEGHFVPTKVEVGVTGEEPGKDMRMVEVVSGLKVGDTVVTSGQFLLDSESRKSEAFAKYLRERLITKKAPATAVASAPSTMPAVASTGRSDDVIKAYLKVATQFGASAKDLPPVDVAGVESAAEAFMAKAESTEEKKAGETMLAAARELKGLPSDRQREQFVHLSAAAVGIVESYPPTKAVGEQVFVITCPMAPGGKASWLQTSDVVANPFFAASMKECGSVTKTVKLGGGR